MKKNLKPRASAKRIIWLIIFFTSWPLLFFINSPLTGAFWDWANVLGYIATGLFLLLFIDESSARRYHRELGFSVLMFILLHLVLLITKEPLLIEHLKLSAPFYMLAGLIAALLLLFLMVSSLVRYRARWWKSQTVFKQSHKWGSLVVVVLIGVHIIGSYFYLNEIWKPILLVIIVAATVGRYLASGNSKLIENEKKPEIQKDGIKSQSSLMVTVLISASVSTVVIVALYQYRQQMIEQQPMLDVAFEHIKHKQEPCASCHHNYVDDSIGAGGCYDCHKYTEEIMLDMEKTFHNFCRDCHINKSIIQPEAGPKRQCSLCHIDDKIID